MSGETLASIPHLFGPRGRIDALLRLLEQREISRAKAREVIQELLRPFDVGPDFGPGWPPIAALDWGPVRPDMGECVRCGCALGTPERPRMVAVPGGLACGDCEEIK